MGFFRPHSHALEREICGRKLDTDRPLDIRRPQTSSTMDDANDFWDFPDPLTFNFHEHALSLLQILPPDSQSYNALRDALASSNTQTLLSTASNLLAEPSVTVHACQAFRPLLTDLSARWLESTIPLDRILEAFGLLIDVHEELFPYVMRPRHFKAHLISISKGPSKISATP